MENYKTYIISTHNCDGNDTFARLKDTGIFIHLHYVDKLDYFLEYIERIIEYADIYISSSNSDVLNICRDNLRQKYDDTSSVHFIEKPNRGRDISALLVTYKKIILQYKYICFVHDKQAKKDSHIFNEAFTELWLDNLWGNTIGSASYIYDIRKIFENNTSIGVLTPPKPIDLNTGLVYGESWNENIEIARNVAKKIGIRYELKEDEWPPTLGTAFWARADALIKLFQYQWNYDDFGEEPLPDNQTVSHAIERLFAFVAADAGYETCIVMDERYAIKVHKIQNDALTVLNEYVEKMHMFGSIKDVQSRLSCINKIKEFRKKYNKVYLYGAGMMGKQCLCEMINAGIQPDGFVVTDKNSAEESLFGLPVLSIDQLSDFNRCDVGLILCATEKWQGEMAKTAIDGNLDFILFTYGVII